MNDHQLSPCVRGAHQRSQCSVSHCDAIPAFQAVRPLTLRGSLQSLRLRLLDETGRRMVTLAAVETGRAAAR